MTEIARKPIFGKPIDGKRANGGYRCELCGTWIEYCYPGKVLCTSAAASCENLVIRPLIIGEPEPEVDGWDETEAALPAAQQMPGGPERIAALKKVGKTQI